MEPVGGEPPAGTDEVGAELGDQMPVLFGRGADRPVDVEAGRAEARRRQRRDDRAGRSGRDEPLEATGELGRVRVSHQVVRTNADRHERGRVRQVIEQR